MGGDTWRVSGGGWWLPVETGVKGGFWLCDGMALLWHKVGKFHMVFWVGGDGLFVGARCSDSPKGWIGLRPPAKNNRTGGARWAGLGEEKRRLQGSGRAACLDRRPRRPPYPAPVARRDACHIAYERWYFGTDRTDRTDRLEGGPVWAMGYLREVRRRVPKKRRAVPQARSSQRVARLARRARVLRAAQ